MRAGTGNTEGARAVVIAGAGEAAFDAGADIAEFPERRMSTREALQCNSAIATELQAVQNCPAPVIVMVDGLAVGGGCELAAACDVRVAGDVARMGIAIGRLGVPLGAGTIRVTKRIVRTVQHAAAEDSDAATDVDSIDGMVPSVYEGPDLREGVAVFLERRAPRFKDPTPPLYVSVDSGDSGNQPSGAESGALSNRIADGSTHVKRTAT